MRLCAEGFGKKSCPEAHCTHLLDPCLNFHRSKEVPGSIQQFSVVLLWSLDIKQQSSQMESYWDSVTLADGFVFGAQ